jgi:hypothetical protein
MMQAAATLTPTHRAQLHRMRERYHVTHLAIEALTPGLCRGQVDGYNRQRSPCLTEVSTVAALCAHNQW